MKRFSALLLAFIICLGMLAGCGQQAVNDSTDTASAPKKNLQIGFTFDTFVIERWLRDRDVFVATAARLGADVNVQTANGDAQEQINQIEYFIKKKVDVIVIIATEGDKLKDVVKKAKDAGIKVIAYDRLILNCNVDFYISFDNEKVGALMADALKSAMPDGGNILEIDGPTTDNNVTLVDKGFLRELKGTDINIVKKYNCDAWLAEHAFTYATEGLKAYPDIKGIMCGNDDLAGQVFSVLSENRRAGDVTLVGQDADLAACQRIVEGTQLMTVYKPVDSLASKAAEAAVALCKDSSDSENSILKEASTINDGTYDVPYIGLDPIAVTKENMDATIIADNFHTRDEVYLNTKKMTSSD
ncbi:MAG TPA: substrate-binding domain-containing protein [Lachnospiraceae bacterium]|nr:substrate-binding domain-containing protein [Lachnospiraceae bacterium]